VLSLEFVAVQIIAVDTVQNSGLHKTGYLMNAGHFSKNTVSTGDLNRGRRTESRLLFGSFCRSKKNKLVPFREISRFCKPRISAPQRRFRAGRFAAFAGASRRRPLPVHTKRVCRLLCKHSQAANPPFGRSLPGTFHLLLKKQDKRGVGTLSRSLLWEKTA